MSAPARPNRSRAVALACAAAGLLALATCRAADSRANVSRGFEQGLSRGAWDTIYEVLQHPRCLNCHPAGDRPLQGDDSRPHPQNVRRGPDGHGFFAQRCDACHGTANLEGPHLPPGAPGWHLPHPEQPLVFEGLSSPELCRQLRDPARNGGRTPAELEHHLTQDPLVLWGWDPGAGRAPVATPQPMFAAFVRLWVEGGCDCPE